jgi:hypothetical protein
MVFVVFSTLEFLILLILLIWVFSVLILVRLARGPSILFIFSKNQLFVSLIFCMFSFFCYYFIDFSTYLKYFFLSACFGVCLFLFF